MIQQVQQLRAQPRRRGLLADGLAHRQGQRLCAHALRARHVTQNLTQVTSTVKAAAPVSQQIGQGEAAQELRQFTHRNTSGQAALAHVEAAVFVVAAAARAAGMGGRGWCSGLRLPGKVFSVLQHGADKGCVTRHQEAHDVLQRRCLQAVRQVLAHGAVAAVAAQGGGEPFSAVVHQGRPITVQLGAFTTRQGHDGA